MFYDISCRTMMKIMQFFSITLYFSLFSTKKQTTHTTTHISYSHIPPSLAHTRSKNFWLIRLITRDKALIKRLHAHHIILHWFFLRIWNIFKKRRWKEKINQIIFFKYNYKWKTSFRRLVSFIFLWFFLYFVFLIMNNQGIESKPESSFCS